MDAGRGRYQGRRGYPRGTFFPLDDWIYPKDPDIISDNDQHKIPTRLLKPGEDQEIDLAAPAAGKYQLVCTYPRHNVTMIGVFIVSK